MAITVDAIFMASLAGQCGTGIILLIVQGVCGHFGLVLEGLRIRSVIKAEFCQRNPENNFSNLLRKLHKLVACMFR